jgi:ABC-type Fe3+-hydroxamate transport system, periplasmic component
VKGNGITMIPRLRLPLLFLVIGLAACARPPAASPSLVPSASVQASPSAMAYPLTLTDDAGGAVSLTARPERIVTLAPSNTEIVCALDACDKLTGVTDFDDYPPQVKDLPKVVIQAAPDVEKIVAARPDLILAAGNQQTPQAVIDQLTRLGYPVLVLYPKSLDGVEADIELVGRALDAMQTAERITADMRQRIAAVQATVAGATKPRVFYEVSVYQGVIYGAGKDSFLASMIGLAGGNPIVGDATGVTQLENLVAADPQIILLGDAAYPPPVTPAAVAARPSWKLMTAVASGDVRPMTDDLLITRPGPRIVDGLEALARAIHPELFKD